MRVNKMVVVSSEEKVAIRLATVRVGGIFFEFN